ncbi:flagellar assembly protein FliH [Thiobacter aerophilum]|uniref:Flagellar assembly protein FliH n=1 Tax=Thiobacter aerophilum TaxID=3121275 RepID=A0ABV0EEE6_9BURK
MASKPIIPKEQLSAYQRWELASLEDNPPPPPEPAVKLPTAEELERIHQQAYQEGFAAGVREGRAQGEADAHRMRELMQGLDQALRGFEHAMAGEILALALEVARQLVRRTLSVEPERVLDVVREAIESLPQLSEHPVLVLNPDDANLVRQMLAYEYQESVWRVVEDPHMTRGGCRIETAESELDATLETRWKRIVSALGSDGNWND